MDHFSNHFFLNGRTVILHLSYVHARVGSIFFRISLKTGVEVMAINLIRVTIFVKNFDTYVLANFLPKVVGLMVDRQVNHKSTKI